MARAVKPIRLGDDESAMIARAARLEGIELGTFIRCADLVSARRVLADHRHELAVNVDVLELRDEIQREIDG